jgi:phage gpG-like protein
MAFQGELIGSEDLTRKFSILDEALKGEALANGVTAGGMVMLNAVRGKVKDNGLIRTRTLSRSLHQEITETTATSVTVEVGTNLQHAAIHEYGGTIRPKKGKYLAIPIGTLTGSPQTHELKLRKTGAGNLLLVNASGTPQYLLRQSVEIPARPYMRPAWDENQEAIQTEVARVARQKIMKAAE